MLRAAETIAKTDTGRHRLDNEDSVLARAPVFVVADGMGGAQAGEVASKIAVQTFEGGLPGSGSAEERLAGLARDANRRIYDLSRTQHERAGMGTTLTAAYLGDADLAIAHVGDSRAYMFRAGSLNRLTQDHSLVDELVRSGKLTEEQAAEHPQRSIITRALGPEASVKVDTWTYPVRAGDVLLLCTDGLTSMIAEDRMGEILAAPGTIAHAADALISAANDAGGRDNITVVLVRLEEAGDGEGAAEQQTMVGLSPRAHGLGGAGSRGPAVALAPRGVPAPREAHAPREALAARGEVAPLAPLAPSAPRAAPNRPRERRGAKPVAAVLATLIVLGLLGAGGWLATRQLYFVGTNTNGIVTIYRGVPYDLPAGLELYETFYVSGVPGALIPADRRAQVLDHHLRSETSATTLVRDLELGRVSR